MRAKLAPWFVSTAAFVAFALIAWQVQVVGSGLIKIDQTIAVDAKDHSADHPELLAFARIATNAGGTTAMPVLAILGSLLFFRRWPALAVTWVLAALLGLAISEATKAILDRPRPDETLRDITFHERNASYPSGHSMASMISYGFLTYFGWVVLSRRWPKVALTFMFATLVLVIGWTRIYLRAHWLSDVLGGWALGLAWLSFCMGVQRFFVTNAADRSMGR